MTSNVFSASGLLLGICFSCNASSPDAWEEFREEVFQAADSSANMRLVDYTISVDPFGSDSYGVAIIQGKDSLAGEDLIYIAVFDKVTLSIELCGPFSTSDLAWWQSLLDDNRRLREKNEALRLYCALPDTVY